MLSRLRLPPPSISEDERRRAAQIRDGLRYVAGHRSLAVPMVLIVIVGQAARVEQLERPRVHAERASEVAQSLWSLLRDN